jgi:hypothetical protein
MSVVHVGRPPNGWEDAWGDESHILLFHNFEGLSQAKGVVSSSPVFNSFGNEWTVELYPGGDSTAKSGHVSVFLRNCSGPTIFTHLDVRTKNSSGEYVKLNPLYSPYTGSAKLETQEGRGWTNFAPRALIMDSNVLQRGSLVLEVRIWQEQRWKFIPKNPFMRNMLQLLSDEESSDISFKVEFQSLLGKSDSFPNASSEIFYAHKFVLKTCAKGSILAPLCENCDKSQPVLIKDVHPRVFRLLLRYIYGGDITSAEWKDQGKDLIEAADKYGLTSLKLEAESWYVKLFKPSANNVVEALAYADRMNCFLLKENATEFIAANLDEVLSSGTLKNETKDIMHDILVSVAKMTNKGQKRNSDNDDLNQLSIDDLRAKLASKGKDVDGSRATLIDRLKQTNSVDA